MPSEERRDINATKAHVDARDLGRWPTFGPPIQTPTQQDITNRMAGGRP